MASDGAMRGGRTLLLYGAMIMLLAAPARAQGDATGGGFVTGIADLPLMAGLTEDSGTGLVFDKPEGRIVEAYATGPVSRAQVRTFYAETLSQLGWRPAGEGAYTREGEILRIGISGGDGTVTVRFSLSPQ